MKAYGIIQYKIKKWGNIMKYYDITKLENITISLKVYYEIRYISSINDYKYSITTYNPRTAIYEYLKALSQSNYNLKILKNNNTLNSLISQPQIRQLKVNYQFDLYQEL